MRPAHTGRSARPSTARATPCHRPHQRGQGPHLVALDRTEEVPDDWSPGGPGAFPAVRGVVLPHVARARRRGRPRTASGPNPLVTATTRTASGSPPARSIRSPNRARRPATSSLAEEGGDVEIVVTQIELVFRARVASAKMSTVPTRPEKIAGARSRRRPAGALLPTLEPGGDDRDPHLVAHVVVDHRAEDDVGVGMRHRVDDLGRLVDLEQAQVGAAGDVEEDPAGTLDGRLEQRDW